MIQYIKVLIAKSPEWQTVKTEKAYTSMLGHHQAK